MTFFKTTLVKSINICVNFVSGTILYITPANLLFQAIKSLLATQVQIHTRLDVYVTQTEFKDQNDMLFKYEDRNDTPLQV